jgi:hypothetical protein
MIKGLPRRHLRPAILAFLILITAAGVARSAGTSVVVYSTDFSSDPGWVTRDPYSNHWDEAMGMYHYSLRAAGTDFVFKKIPYHGESFQLDYDLLPVETDFQSSFRMGLGNQNMLINQGTTIFSEFENGSYGNLMWLRVIDLQNQRREVSSYGMSYGGPTVHFSDGIPYHVLLAYSRELRTATIGISFLSNGTTLWGSTLSGIANIGPMDRIYLSAIGDTANPSAVAEGFVDNVTMHLIVPPGVPETPAFTSSPTRVTGGETETPPASPTPPLTTSVPVTTRKSSPSPFFIALTALTAAATLAMARRR